MAVTAYKYAGTAANVDRDGKTAWVNPNNAKEDDTSYSEAYPVEKNEYSDWLRLTNFGFSSSDIPDGSTINGIEFVVSRFAIIYATNTDSAIYLYDDGAVGSNMASATVWPVGSPPIDATYGGSTNMCGTSLTQADIVASTFGIQLSALSKGGSEGFDVDYIKIRVYYTAGGGATGQPTSKRFGGVPFATLRNGIWCL